MDDQPVIIIGDKVHSYGRYGNFRDFINERLQSVHGLAPIDGKSGKKTSYKTEVKFSDGSYIPISYHPEGTKSDL